MVVEQETQSLIIFGFSIVLVIVIFSIFFAWRKTKNRVLLWFIPQLIMLSICLLLFLQLIHNQNTVPAAMLSEENSLTIGLMGISWALSMIFMMVGIISMSTTKQAKIYIKDKPSN
jgi:hypothetical protein